MQNSWRVPKADKDPEGILKITRNQILWRTKKEVVFAEIAALLGIQTADANTPGWLGKRMKALRNVYERMPPEEKAELEMERKRISIEGHPKDLRQQYVRWSRRVPPAHANFTLTLQDSCTLLLQMFG